MAKKKKPDDEVKHRPADPNVMGLHPEVLEQPITETLEINYMPYAMSVICILVSGARWQITRSGLSTLKNDR